MEPLSERDLEQAARFRNGVHREALEIVRRVYPRADSVVDRCPVESYFREIWDYPGAWYTIVAIPEAFDTRDALVETIARDTLSWYSRQKEGSIRTEQS